MITSTQSDIDLMNIGIVSGFTKSEKVGNVHDIVLPNDDKETLPQVVIFPGAEAGIKNPNNSTCRVICPGLIGLRCQSSH